MNERNDNRLLASLTPGQLRVLRFALVATAALLLAACIVAAVWVLALTLSTFRALLVPLAVAGVLALILYPLLKGMVNTLQMPRVLAAGLLTLLLTALLPALIWVFGPMLLKQLVALYDEAAALAGVVYQNFAGRLPAFDEYLREQLNENGVRTWLPDFDGMFKRIGSYIAMLVGLSFVPLFLFFFLLTGPRLKESLEEITSMTSADTQKEIHYLVDVFIGYVAAFFQGQLLIALIMGVLYATGFSLIGLDAALPLGMFAGLLNIVPFLGMVIGLVLVIPYAWLADGGGPQLALLALLVFVTVQLIESWLLTPRIMSERSGLHPAIVVLSLFFWGTALGGIIGVILAVPLSAFVATLWQQVRYRYTATVVAADSGAGIVAADDELPALATEQRKQE